MEFTRDELLALLLLIEHEENEFGLNEHEISAKEKLEEKYQKLC